MTRRLLGPRGGRAGRHCRRGVPACQYFLGRLPLRREIVVSGAPAGVVVGKPLPDVGSFEPGLSPAGAEHGLVAACLLLQIDSVSGAPNPRLYRRSIRAFVSNLGEDDGAPDSRGHMLQHREM